MPFGYVFLAKVLYEYDYFFVENDKEEWAVFDKDEIYIDFIDISQIKELPKHNNFPYDSYTEVTYDAVLIIAMQEKKRALQDKRYTLPLKRYLKQFDPLKSERHLRETGLWYHQVKVTKIPKQYEEIIDKNTPCYIGWSYPSSANMFDMREELPVMFRKVDGSDLTLGIRVEDLELKLEILDC